MPSIDQSIFSSDFKEEPYWWEAFRPQAIPTTTLPAKTDVVVVGGGYAGLATARALADGGVQSLVLEAGEFGTGASTRSGGALSAGLSIGKSFTGRTLDYAPELVRDVVGWAIDAYRGLIDLVEQEKIDCHLEQRGRFLGACAASHYEGLRTRFEKLRSGGATDCKLISREEQRQEIGSDFYHGGMVFETAGKLHPALFYGGLLAAARRRNSITLAGGCRATGLSRDGEGWRVKTEAGEVRARHVVVATNGYTGGLTPTLQRRLVPIASHIIATEELPPGLAAKICPKGRTFSETRRVLHYYRLSPDGKRVIFGGRARFTEIPGEMRAQLLHRASGRAPTGTGRHQGDPHLAGQRRLHLRRLAACRRTRRAALRGGLQRLGRVDDAVPGRRHRPIDRRPPARKTALRRCCAAADSALFRQALVPAGDRRCLPGPGLHRRENQMSATFFSATYREARQRFLDAAREGGRCRRHRMCIR